MQNDNLVAQAQTFFKATFIDYIGVDDSEIINSNGEKIPKNWIFSYVREFCDDNISNLSNDSDIHEILYLDTGSITNNYIDYLQSLNFKKDNVPSRAKRIVYAGDIVYSTVRPNLRHFGIIQNPPANLIVSTGFSVLHNNGKGVSNELLYMWLTSDSVLEYLQAVAENSVSTYPAINSSDLLDIRIVVPDDITLLKANRTLKSLFQAIEDNNNQIKVLKDSLSMVIAKLLSSH